jgi:hypothetical protein
MSPKHYAIDQNVQNYTGYFDGTKTIEITFSTAFDKPPMVQVTGSDSGIMPLYKTNVTTTGVKIRCKTAWTGEVDVMVVERS